MHNSYIRSCYSIELGEQELLTRRVQQNSTYGTTETHIKITVWVSSGQVRQNLLPARALKFMRALWRRYGVMERRGDIDQCLGEHRSSYKLHGRIFKCSRRRRGEDGCPRRLRCLCRAHVVRTLVYKKRGSSYATSMKSTLGGAMLVNKLTAMEGEEDCGGERRRCCGCQAVVVPTERRRQCSGMACTLYCVRQDMLWPAGLVAGFLRGGMGKASTGAGRALQLISVVGT